VIKARVCENKDADELQFSKPVLTIISQIHKNWQLYTDLELPEDELLVDFEFTKE